MHLLLVSFVFCGLSVIPYTPCRTPLDFLTCGDERACALHLYKEKRACNSLKVWGCINLHMNGRSKNSDSMNYFGWVWAARPLLLIIKELLLTWVRAFLWSGRMFGTIWSIWGCNSKKSYITQYKKWSERSSFYSRWVGTWSLLGYNRVSYQLFLVVHCQHWVSVDQREGQRSLEENETIVWQSVHTV